MMNMNETIPILIRQLGENVLSDKTNDNLRFNSLQTIERVRDYCNHVIEKSSKRKGRR